MPGAGLTIPRNTFLADDVVWNDEIELDDTAGGAEGLVLELIGSLAGDTDLEK